VREDGEVEGRGIEWGIERGKGRGQAFAFRNLWTFARKRKAAVSSHGRRRREEKSGRKWVAKKSPRPDSRYHTNA
jgi:hypothetical protein